MAALLGAAGVVVVALLASLPAPAEASGSPVASLASRAGGDGPDPGRALFGPDLDPTQKSLATYEKRLGTDVSLAGTTLPYPLDADAVDALQVFSSRASAAGAAAVITLEPARLTGLYAGDAQRLADVLSRLAQADGSVFFVRFAPEMNGSWTAWGQQPEAYVSAFQTVARAVHAAQVPAAMLWSPAYGAGYPYDRAVNATTTRRDAAGLVGDPAVLDTDGNGTVDDRDDPYGLYYPGDTAVDWVGLTVLRYGVRPEFGANTEPAPDELDERLDERFGYSRAPGSDTFYDTFVLGHDKPMMLVTGAMWNPEQGGADQRDIKTAWLDQVIAATVDRPRIRGVLWLEKRRAEAEIGNQVSWDLVEPPRLARAARDLLVDSPLSLGPIAGVDQPDDLSIRGFTDGMRTATVAPDAESSAGAPDAGDTTESAFDRPIGAGPSNDVIGLPPFLAGALTTLAVVLVAGTVALRARRRRMLPPWLR